MDRVYQANAIETPPSTIASSGSYPTAGNKASGQLATVPGPYWFYSITEEIRNAVIKAGITPDASKVNQLAEALGKYLPLSGGTMTGTIASSAEVVLKKTADDSELAILGGSDKTSSRLILCGKDSTTSGKFNLIAQNASGICELLGNADGNLTWNGKDVVRITHVSGGQNGYMRFNNGITLQWGYFDGTASYGTLRFALTYNTVLGIWAQLASYCAEPRVISIPEKTVSTFDFDCYAQQSNGATRIKQAFYWWALGYIAD